MATTDFVCAEPKATQGPLIDPNTTEEQQLAFVGITLGAVLGKIALMAATDVKTGEKKAVLVATPPEGINEAPIPLAVLIDGDPYAQFAPGHDFVDLDVYRAAASYRQAA